jgi:hypothetical protein
VRRYHRKDYRLPPRCINDEVGISAVTSDNIGLDFDGITFKVDGQHAEPGSGWKGKVEMTGGFLFCVCNSRISIC